MNEKLKEIFIKQMLLPKEELAMQTMELMADKMDLQSKIDKAIEILDKLEMQPAYLDCKYYELGGFDELRNALKEDK